ncbi:MAG TPA: dienelactone hydrolase family protein [Ktedonosporobacter sp.]|nr:dienelactone hydrolase family protein [Ktedonosporobacter sp.]
MPGFAKPELALPLQPWLVMWHDTNYKHYCLYHREGDDEYMCYDDNAKPPVPPGATSAAHGEDLMLTAADGTRFAAYIARPANPGAAQILIYPDVRGLHQFYKDLALRFAEKGITAIAIDYFGRTTDHTIRDESFEFWPHVQQFQFPNLLADAQAALDYLKGEGQRTTFLTGFCMGGSLTLMTGIQGDFNFAGLIPFYAGLSRQLPGTNGTVLDETVHIHSPTLGLFGGADQGIPVEQVHTLDANLDKAGIEHEIVIYDGAPHSFFDRRATDFAEASSDAWQRVLSFIASHTDGA